MYFVKKHLLVLQPHKNKTPFAFNKKENKKTFSLFCNRKKQKLSPFYKKENKKTLLRFYNKEKNKKEVKRQFVIQKKKIKTFLLF